MNIPKKTIFDRIDESFNLFKNNFKEVFLPIFIYNTLSLVVIGTIVIYFFLVTLGGSLNNIKDLIEVGSLDFFTYLNNPFVVTTLVISTFLFLLYLILYIPVLLGTIRTISQAYNEEKVDMFGNFKYGLINLFNSFKTYWYIFAYVALIPAIIFIIGGVLLNIGLFTSGDFLVQVGGAIMGIGGIIFFVFAIYRGIKTSFSIFSAVGNNSFTKDDFKISVDITKNNWRRILGNFLLLGIIISILSSLVSAIVGLLTPSSFDFSSIDIQNPSNIDIGPILESFSIWTNMLSGFISTIIKTIGGIFVIIFTYIFFKRLEMESNNGTGTHEVPVQENQEL